jgi:predicted phosphohydrolase
VRHAIQVCGRSSYLIGGPLPPVGPVDVARARLHLTVAHERHDQIQIPPGEVLIHAGDSTMAGRVEEIAIFNHWLGTLPHQHKILIAGNHDWLFEREPALAESLITNAIYLRDSSVIIEGIKFYGSP